MLKFTSYSVIVTITITIVTIRQSNGASASSPHPRLHGIIPPIITPLIVKNNPIVSTSFSRPNDDNDNDDDNDNGDEDGGGVVGSGGNMGTTMESTCSVLDVESLRNLVGRMIEGGVDGIFVLGTSGEGPSCPKRLKVEMIRQTCWAVREKTKEKYRCSYEKRKRGTRDDDDHDDDDHDDVIGRRRPILPVLVGVTDTSLEESLDLARVACEAGAYAVVLAPPFYLPLSDELIRDYVRQFCERCPLPVILYNIPMCTGTRNSFRLDLYRHCCSRFPDKIIGIKESSGDMDLFADLVREFGRDDDDDDDNNKNNKNKRGLSIFMGPEDKIADAVMMGADGGVPGGANFCPELYVHMYRAARRSRASQRGQKLRTSSEEEQQQQRYDDDDDEDRRLRRRHRHLALEYQALAKRVCETILKVGTSWPASIIQGLKAASEIEGTIRCRASLPPVPSLRDDDEMERVRMALRPILERFEELRRRSQ